MISYFSKLPTNISNYYLSNVKKNESSSHIIVPVLFESVIKDISPKDSPGMKVLTFYSTLLFYVDGKYKLHDPL